MSDDAKGTGQPTDAELNAMSRDELVAHVNGELDHSRPRRRGDRRFRRRRVAQQTRIVEFAAANRLPPISSFRGFTDSGGLMSYGPNLHE